MEQDKDSVVFEVEFSENQRVSYEIPWYYKIPIVGQFLRYFMERIDVID